MPLRVVGWSPFRWPREQATHEEAVNAARTTIQKAPLAGHAHTGEPGPTGESHPDLQFSPDSEDFLAGLNLRLLGNRGFTSSLNTEPTESSHHAALLRAITQATHPQHTHYLAEKYKPLPHRELDFFLGLARLTWSEDRDPEPTED